MEKNKFESTVSDRKLEFMSAIGLKVKDSNDHAIEVNNAETGIETCNLDYKHVTAGSDKVII